MQHSRTRVCRTGLQNSIPSVLLSSLAPRADRRAAILAAGDPADYRGNQGASSATQARHDTGAVHLHVQALGIEISRVGTSRLNLANLAGTGCPAGSLGKLGRVRLPGKKPSLASRTPRLGRSGDWLSEAAGGSDGQQAGSNKSLRPAAGIHDLVDA
jgi:hypothetical protein